MTVVVIMYLLPVVLSLQPGAVSLSSGETCHCSAAGPDQQRSAAGYTPHTASRPRPDLEEHNRDESDCGRKLQGWVGVGADNTERWCWNMSVTWGWSLLDWEADGCRCGPVHQLLTHPSKGKDLPTLQELRGAERSLHPWGGWRKMSITYVGHPWYSFIACIMCWKKFKNKHPRCPHII